MARTCEIAVTQKFLSEDGPDLAKLTELLTLCEQERRREERA